MPDRPNVLFVMADQFRADCVGADPRCPVDENGDPVVHTPTLDALAADGAFFSRAYTPNPVCVPARRCLWTGQTAATNGCTGGNSTEPWEFAHTLPRCLRDAGYQTRLVDKTHAQPMKRGTPHHSGFGFGEMETHVGASVYEDDYGRWLRERGGDDRRGTGLSHRPRDARPWHREEFEHPTNWTTRRALGFLERRDETRPFFLALSYVRPHAPLDPPQAYWDQYAERDLPEPVVGDWVASRYPDHDRAPAILRDAPRRQDQRLRAGYFGLATHVDHQLHRVLYELEWRHGVREDTVVVFTADHGEMLSDHHHWAKSEPYEPSVRVPLLLDPPDSLAPDRPSGRIVDRLVGLEDLMPTLLGLADVPVPDTVEGHDLHRLLEDPAETHRPYYHGENGAAPASHYLVGESIKYVWFPVSGDELLFDLDADPDETTDRSADPAYRDERDACRAALAGRLAGREEGFVVDGELTPVAGE